MSEPNRLSSGGLIDRAKPIQFSFNGRRLSGYAGDTLASALLANGIHLVGRSFKYHRPRGIVAAGVEDPNAIVQIKAGPRSVPNARATEVELVEGLSASSVNAWPRVDFDIGAVNGYLARFLPAGFYYKTFMWPATFWKRYEHWIRRAAGLGKVPREADPDRYEKRYAHCDVLVVGAGPAGLMAARSAAEMGARVLMVDEKPQLGGSLLGEHRVLDQRPASDWLAEQATALAEIPDCQILTRTTAIGAYDDNFIVLVERISDHLPNPPRYLPRERMWRVRARQVILATGAHERPIVFPNNDRPGVMLASAASTYLKRFAVKPGSRAVVFTNNDSAYRVALDLHAHGVPVQAVVDARPDVVHQHIDSLKAANVEVILGAAVTDIKGKKHVTEVELSRLNADASGTTGVLKTLACDLLAVSGGWSPVLHLYAHAGGKAEFAEQHACFVPGSAVTNMSVAGSANGAWSLSACFAQGARAGADAALAAGFAATSSLATPAVDEPDMQPIRPLWLVPGDRPPAQMPKQFVDLQNDSTAADIALAVREGYRSVEHMKRYTATGFGTDQGKLGNINGAAILANNLQQSIAATGTTTFRPPYTPVTFGAVAGRDLGDYFEPIRKTALHSWHLEQGAKFENVGQWKRPWYYPRDGENMHQAVNRECLATRRSVGILDASTLGKIDIRGPDAGEFLNRVYTNAWKKLAIGRSRYGLMLGEDGMVMDDGVTSRLAEDHYLMTTTTGGAANVLAWLERWRQTEWPELQVYMTSVTDHWATLSLAGPNSRRLLEKLSEECDLSNAGFPFMSFKDMNVAGIAARVFRISFSGELAFEVNVPANYARYVWEALWEAGQEFDITAYGTEAMHVLRAEKGYIIVGQDTDGSVTPVDLGMAWIVSANKDFLGARSLQRSDTVRTDRKQLVGLLTENPDDVLPEGAQLVDVLSDARPLPMQGHVTSSYYSACLKHSIALALVVAGHSRRGDTLYAPLADGRTIKASICDPVFYDPSGERQSAA